MKLNFFLFLLGVTSSVAQNIPSFDDATGFDDILGRIDDTLVDDLNITIDDVKNATGITDDLISQATNASTVTDDIVSTINSSSVDDSLSAGIDDDCVKDNCDNNEVSMTIRIYNSLQ